MPKLGPTGEIQTQRQPCMILSSEMSSCLPMFQGPSALRVACSPRNLVESQPGKREEWTSYFPPTSKAENYEFVMWRRAWHRPRRASWDPAPNLHLVTLGLGRNSTGILVSSGLSCPWVHHHCAPRCSGAGRAGRVREASR